MHMQSSLLAAAIVAALAVSAPATAGKFDQSPAAVRAKGLVDGRAASATHRADADTFSATDVIVDRNGTEHVRMQRSWRGLPVIGGDVVVHSRNGQFKSASLSLKSNARPGTAGRIGGDEATIVAGADFGSDFEGMRNARKVVYALRGTPKLAYEVIPVRS